VKEIQEKLAGYNLPVIGVIPFDNDLVKADLEIVSPIERKGAAFHR